ncbi:MAG: NAD(P)H-dependent glycerol-3-phosphate dehydrogenase [bacterium]
MTKISVIGGGSWGTALADLFSRKGYRTALWIHGRELSRQISRLRENRAYLPGVKLLPNLQATNLLEEALHETELVVMAVPSHVIRPVLRSMKKHLPHRVPLLSASKGIEQSRFLRVSQIIGEELGGTDRLAVLSGPNFAREVARELPAAAVIAACSKELAVFLQNRLSTPRFRIYTSDDVIGVELGGALKNVIAIAAGVCDGLGFGFNARAALITRGLAEMTRLGAALGADRLTFMGLAGMGDLLLTCTGDLSRNRRVGLGLSRGKRLEEILEEMKMVAEGVKTSEAAVLLGKQTGVELPIMEGVWAMLYRNQPPRELIDELLNRDLRPEN